MNINSSNKVFAAAINKEDPRAVKRTKFPKMMSTTKSNNPSAFTSFCEDTSLDGLKYIGGAKKLTPSRRIFWLVAVLANFGACCWFLIIYIQSFYSRSVVTTIDTTAASLSEVFFPSVTVCNVNQLQESFLDFLNMTRDQFSLFEQEFIIGRDTQTSPVELALIDGVLTNPGVINAFLDKFSQLLGWPRDELYAMYLAGLLNEEQAMTRMATQMPAGAMVPYAKYNNTELFHKVSSYSGTDFGICAKIISYLFNYTGNLFTVQPPALADVKPGVINGERNGMTLLLDAEVYDYAYRSYPGEGFVMALHHHRDVPVLRQFGFNIAPGTVVSIAVNPILTVTTSEAESRFQPDSRGCYFDEEIQLTHWPYTMNLTTTDFSQRGEEGRYSMTNCLLESALEKIALVCKCTPSFHMLGFNMTADPICQGIGITCVNDILDQLGNIDTIMDRGVNKTCMAACQDQVNPYQLSFLNFPNRKVFSLRPEICYLTKNIRDRCGDSSKRRLLEDRYSGICINLNLAENQLNTTLCDPDTWTVRSPVPYPANETVDILEELLYTYARENLALVNVFIKDPYVTRLKIDQALPIIDFVAGLGGLLGVFTGFSFVSLVEILYYLREGLATTKMR